MCYYEGTCFPTTQTCTKTACTGQWTLFLCMACGDESTRCKVDGGHHWQESAWMALAVGWHSSSPVEPEAKQLSQRVRCSFFAGQTPGKGYRWLILQLPECTCTCLLHSLPFWGRGLGSVWLVGTELDAQFHHRRHRHLTCHSADDRNDCRASISSESPRGPPPTWLGPTR
jgi:hypothetical protein